jgi:hypothetical protein
MKTNFDILSKVACLLNWGVIIEMAEIGIPIQ